MAGRATNEIEARLDELRAEVEAAERKVGDYKARNDLVDAQGRLIADDEILKLNDQLTVARARTLGSTPVPSRPASSTSMRYSAAAFPRKSAPRQ